MLLAERLTIKEIAQLKRVIDEPGINVVVTNHFVQRWRERVKVPSIYYRNDLIQYLETILRDKRIEQINDNHFIIDDDIIIVGKYSNNNNKFVFITTYGSTKDNPILYNMCVVGDVNENLRKYGKLSLN